MELTELRGAMRKDKIKQDWVDFAIGVWADNTRKSERKRDSIRNPKNKSDKTLYRIHWLEMRRSDMASLMLKLGKEKFGNEFHFSYWYAMKVNPFWIKPVGRDVVVCVYCLRFDLMVESLYQYRQRNRTLKFCDCKFTNHKNSRDFRMSLICERKEGSRYDDPKCISQNCEECKDLKLMPKCEEVEEDLEDEGMDHLTIKWEKYDTIEYKTRDGIVKNKRDFVTISNGSISEFLQHFRAYWPRFVLHLDCGKWQSAEALLLKTPPRGVVGAVQDFSENLSVEPKREHQSRYYAQVSITLYGTMFYINVDDLENISEDERKKLKKHLADNDKHPVIKEFHCVVSPDLHHDNAFVQHCNDKILTPYLIKNVKDLKRISTISDGAPTQYKMSTHALWVSSHKRKTGIQADWCFRGTAHGKDEVDGACGDCKNAVQREQLKAERGETSKLKTSKDVMKFFTEKMTTFYKDYYTKKGAGVYRRVFHYVPSHGDGAVDRNIRGCATLNGIKKIHQMLDIGEPGKLMIRTRSCHCDSCWNGRYGECANKERCGDPWTVCLQPKAHRRLAETPVEIAEVGLKISREAQKDAVVCVMVRQEHEPWMLGKVCGSLGSYELKSAAVDTPYATLVPGDVVLEVRKLEPINPGTKVFDVTTKVFPVRAKDVRLGKIEVEYQQVRRSRRGRSAPQRLGMRSAAPSFSVENESTQRCEISSATHAKILASILVGS